MGIWIMDMLRFFDDFVWSSDEERELVMTCIGMCHQ